MNSPAPEGAVARAPRVTVLMATFNGRRWIDAQVNSVLGQRGVEVRLLVSDDGSSDGTREHLVERARDDTRIVVLPQREGEPGVTANFLHLLETHVPDGSYVAFCDQDDVWHVDKLERQIAQLQSIPADAVSSNVVSFDSGGHRHLIKKSHPMKRWDHLFEAAGPGSTYVFTSELHERLRSISLNLDHSGIGVHDWYVYALARAIGARWAISSEPTVDYRQHEANVQGANAGAAARHARVSKLRSGFYKNQFILTARAVSAINTYDDRSKSDLADLLADLESEDLGSRMRMLFRWSQIRRSGLEGFELAFSHLIGIW